MEIVGRLLCAVQDHHAATGEANEGPSSAKSDISTEGPRELLKTGLTNVHLMTHWFGIINQINRHIL